MREIKHLSVHQWLRSAIPDSQQPISPIGFLFLKLPPPPCAVLLVYLWDYYGISKVMSMVFLWDSYGFQHGVNGISVGSLWDFYWMSMGFLWDFCGISKKCLLDFYDISMVLLVDFYGIPMAFLWGFHDVSMIFL